MTGKQNARAGIYAVLCLGLTALLGGCGPQAAAPTTTTGPALPAASPVRTGWVPPGTLDAAAARTALDRLTVAQEGPQAGYQRSCAKGAACVFGPAWADTDANGRDQRNDVLARDLSAIATKPGTHDRVVLSGTLDDPYTGKRITFTRGPRSADIQVDHVASLGQSWRDGASKWPQDKRVRFATDLANLVAVDGSANGSKSDQGPAEWLPPAPASHCGYAEITITVKAKYDLTLTPRDKTALTAALASCPFGSSPN